MDQTLSTSIDNLIKQFNNDGYIVNKTTDVIIVNNRIGMRATHKTATIGTTGKKKKVYYLEGSGYQMGYLFAKLANVDIVHMCNTFMPNIFFSFVNIDDPDERKRLQQTILDIGYWVSRAIEQDVPSEYIEELKGIIAGCNELGSPVAWQNLWLLNAGIDALLAVGYTGTLPLKKPLPIGFNSKNLRMPIFCNGFCVSGNSPDNYFYMGRDFQFSTGGIFQDTATMIIRKPDKGIPTVSVAAPGIIGTISGFNTRGIGIGVDMLPGNNCNVFRPGLNSLLLTRYTIENSETCEKAVDVIRNANRGVSWLYIVGDGNANRSCVVEAGMTQNEYNGLEYMSEWAHEAAVSACPQFEALINESSKQFQNGISARWNDYKYPNNEFISLNEALMNAYKSLVDPGYDYPYNPSDFSERGYFRKCPASFYFAPQREARDNLVVVTNHAVEPHMRLFSMTDWIYTLAKNRFDDIQSRYDKLNAALLNTLDKGFITYNEAKQIISTGSPLLSDESGSVIGGAVSIMDLKEKTIESHYGYTNDEWVKLKLINYV